MARLYKNNFNFIASSEGVFIILLLTLSIYCLILPSANKDLFLLSNDNEGLLQAFILSPTQLRTVIEDYGAEGRSLYQFILLTVGLASILSLFIITILTGHWLNIKRMFWKHISVWLFPLCYLTIASLELALFYFLLNSHTWESLYIFTFTICISILRRISMVLLFGSILMPLSKYFILLRRRYRSKK